MITIHVTCYAGHRAEETPRSIRFVDREILVRQILDMWLAPDHRYFKFTGSDNGLYIVRHDVYRHLWELVLFRDVSSISPEPPPANNIVRGDNYPDTGGILFNFCPWHRH